MSAPWARDGEPDLACALALVGRETLGANRDGRAHITTSRVIVTWNHIEIGIGGEASITAGAMPAVLGQIGFVGAVVKHGPLWAIERGAVGISSIRSALECKLAAPLVRPTPRRASAPNPALARSGAVYAALASVPSPRPSHHHGANFAVEVSADIFPSLSSARPANSSGSTLQRLPASARGGGSAKDSRTNV